MAITQIWSRFGGSIADAPHLTLASFLGHAPSIEVAKQHGIAYPSDADFRSDPTYDPNRHKLDLEKDYLDSKFLVLSVATWGAEALYRIVNTCSLLQCMHHSPSSAHFKRLRDEAASCVNAMIDNRTDELRKKADALHQRCSEEYKPHEKQPDSKAAQAVWYQLGAPWFAIETCRSDLTARDDSREKEPGPSNQTWITRETVWPSRAIDAAAHWSSFNLVNQVLRSTLISWASTQR
ncbi:MAG: hypothetical protein JNM18_23730 [Planctomycetaceae bacterium]|nr:hypothetical protein [Planctomycetaceae bacterium]